MSKQLTVSLHFVYTKARSLEPSPTKADVIEGDRVGFIFDPEGDIVWATVTSIAEGISGEIGILRFDPPPPCGREGRNGWETPDAWVSHATICEGDFVSAIDRCKTHVTEAEPNETTRYSFDRASEGMVTVRPCGAEQVNRDLVALLKKAEPTSGEIRIVASPLDGHPDGTSVQVWCPDWLSDDAPDLRARNVPHDQWPHAWFDLEWLRNRGRAKDFLQRWVVTLRRKADGAAREADQYQAALDTLADVEAEDCRPE